MRSFMLFDSKRIAFFMFPQIWPGEACYPDHNEGEKMFFFAKQRRCPAKGGFPKHHQVGLLAISYAKGTISFDKVPFSLAIQRLSADPLRIAAALLSESLAFLLL